MTTSYRIARLCGLLPLLAGVTIFLLWLVTDNDVFMVAGILTMYAGTIVVVFGLVVLARFYWKASVDTEIPRRKLKLSTALCAALLLINFPAAVGLSIIAIWLKTEYSITIHNASSAILHDVRVVGGGEEAWFGTLSPGENTQNSIWISTDGTLRISAVREGDTISGVIDDYVTNNMGGNTHVTIHPDKTISVQYDSD